MSDMQIEEYRQTILRKAPHNWHTVNKLMLYQVARAEAASGLDGPEPSWIWSSDELADFLKVSELDSRSCLISPMC